MRATIEGGKVVIKPNPYTLEKTDRFSEQYPCPAFRVHASMGCGRAFQDVAAILEPDSPNPCMLILRPLGVNGVKLILDAFEAHQIVQEMKRKPSSGQVMRAERWDADCRRYAGRWRYVTFKADWKGVAIDTQFHDAQGVPLADPIRHERQVEFKLGEIVHAGINPNDCKVSLEVEHIGEYGTVWIHGLTQENIDFS